MTLICVRDQEILRHSTLKQFFALNLFRQTLGRHSVNDKWICQYLAIRWRFYVLMTNYSFASITRNVLDKRSPNQYLKSRRGRYGESFIMRFHSTDSLAESSNWIPQSDNFPCKLISVKGLFWRTFNHRFQSNVFVYFFHSEQVECLTSNATFKRVSKKFQKEIRRYRKSSLVY